MKISPLKAIKIKCNNCKKLDFDEFFGYPICRLNGCLNNSLGTNGKGEIFTRNCPISFIGDCNVKR